MNRSIRRKLRDLFAARRGASRAFVACVTMLAMLAPCGAWAGTPYTLHWFMSQENPTCEAPHLVDDGDAFFNVNDTPLPTFEVPGAFMTHGDGSESNVAEAPFDSVLLLMGANDFLFHVANSSGYDGCVHADEVVSLVSAPLGLNKPLFDIRRDGTAFSGKTQVDLSLAEINPPLARDIANLEELIAAERASLIENAAKTADLADKLSLLQELDTELHDLVSRPLDEIAQTDLDAILDRYADLVDEATRAALAQLLGDLKQSVLELENELASLIDVFGAQADAVANLATQAAQGAGWNPDDPAGYGLGVSNVPWVEIPDLSDVPGAFTPGNDPYAAYADKVIAALAEDVSGSEVVGRADFVANVRAWRANEAALAQALAMHANVSQAETNAFLNGQNKVTSYVHQFMDASDWFADSPVPADLRADVDGVLKNGFGPLADQMKDGLNLWDGGALNLEQTELYQTISGFAGAMSTIGDGVGAYGELMVTLVHATERVAVGFVPYVGPALDLCEVVTGKAWCLPGGDELSTEQRIFSGVGVAIGSVGQFWGGAKNAAVPAAAKVVAEDISQFGEELAVAVRANRRTWYKTLRGAVTTQVVNDFEKKAALHLMKDEGRAMIGVGDDGVRKVLGIPKDAPSGLAQAPDFVTMTKGGKLALSEAKGIVSKEGEVDVGKAIAQLTNAMKKVAEKGLAGDVARVEIIIPKGAKLATNYGTKDGYLIAKVTGKTINITDFPLLFIKVVEL
jgi:hypothetical protein